MNYTILNFILQMSERLALFSFLNAIVDYGFYLAN